MPKTQSKRTATVTLRMGEGTKQAVERYASARDMTASEFIRYCVRVYMDTTEERDA